MYIVTGGAGFIGSAMIWRLNEAGIDDILVVDNLASSEKWRNLVNRRYRDYVHRDEFRRMVLEGRAPQKVEAIIHMGACSSTTERNADFLMDNNLHYSQMVCRYALEQGARLINASSAATYGDGSHGFSDSLLTTLSLRPLNMYGYSKQMFDLWAYRENLLKSIASVKFFNVYGPNEYHKGEMKSVACKAFTELRETGSLRLFKSDRPQYPDGGQMRDFVYVKDCVNVMFWLLEHPEANGILNIGSDKARTEAGETLLRLAKKHGAEVAAVGNGTAGRETEAFIRALPGWSIPVVMVSESGASVYSASEAARAEFPDLDLTYRGAVSIGRRLADPLAELVKIDPKSIGVGQYQHDVNQSELKRCLDDVVVSCVNAVGVDLNTASEQLLTYVSGLGPTLARNIVAHRHENGPFQTRRDLLKVPRLGPKAFEQCSGFLRIRDGKQPLDASAVHPEAYAVVERMAKDTGTTVRELMQSPERRKAIRLSDYVTDKLGLPTLTDIMKELEKPGRDPRGPFKPFSFAEGVSTMQDLKQGMKLPGIVTNITAFGAFVDIGVHQDGLVHISQLANRFVRDPNEVVKVHQEVLVTVLDVDIPRKRISLTMRGE